MDAYRNDLLVGLRSGSFYFYSSGVDITMSRKYSDFFGSGGRDGLDGEKQNKLFNIHWLFQKIKMSLTAPNIFVRGRRWALVLKNSLLTLFFCIGKEGSLVPTYRKGGRLLKQKIDDHSKFWRKHTLCCEIDEYIYVAWWKLLHFLSDNLEYPSLMLNDSFWTFN